MISRRRIILRGAGIAVALGLGAAFACQQWGVQLPYGGRKSAQPPRLEAVSARKSQPASKLSLFLSLQEAVTHQGISAILAANGHDTLTVKVSYSGKDPLRIEIPAGLVLRAGPSSIVVIRHQEIELGPNQTRMERVRVAALSAANSTIDTLYDITSESDRRIEPILTYAARHPEVSDEAIQTAILATTDNLPLRAFAKFEMAGADVRSALDTDVFHVDTVDIINALALLRALGFRDENLALTIDPLLKVEAMVDPMAHAAAMSYYRIPFEKEWVWWKSQLLDGDPATRHYALFGIARFYPDIAVQMMPAWARENRLEQVFRSAALQALAETRRAEAVSVLQQLSYELGGDLTDLGRTAGTALKFLTENLQETRNASAPSIRLRGAKVQLRSENAPPRNTVAAIDRH